MIVPFSVIFSYSIKNIIPDILNFSISCSFSSIVIMVPFAPIFLKNVNFWLHLLGTFN